MAARTCASNSSQIRFMTAPFRYSSPFIGGADSASADISASEGLGMERPEVFSRFGWWQRELNSRRASPRQKTNTGGRGSFKNPDASNSNPRAGDAANPSLRRDAL